MNQVPASTTQALSTADRSIINVLVLGVILPLLDTTIVNVALHAIGEQFASSISVTQWIVTAYTLAAACSVPASAWAAQRWGAKRLWISCLWLFLFAATLSGLAWNMGVLVFARVLQGLATGLLLPTMQTIVVRTVGPDKAKAALAAMSVPSVVAPILGPFVGGLLLQYIGWRTVFWLHVPICLVAITLAMRRLPVDIKGDHLGFDAKGLLLLCPGMIFTIYGLSSLSESANLSLASGIGSTTIGTCLMVYFVLNARKKDEEALLDLTLFKHANFRGSCFLLLLSSIIYYGGVLLYPIYFIQSGSYSTNAAGLLLAIHGVGTLLARRQLPVLSGKWGDRRVAFAATALALFGSLLLCWPMFLLHYVAIVMGMLLRGAGVGVLTILSMSGAYIGLDRNQVAHASSMTRMLTYLGATVGAAGVAMTAQVSHGIGVFSSANLGIAHLSLLAVTAICWFATWRAPG